MKEDFLTYFQNKNEIEQLIDSGIITYQKMLVYVIRQQYKHLLNFYDGFFAMQMLGERWHKSQYTIKYYIYSKKV